MKENKRTRLTFKTRFIIRIMKLRKKLMRQKPFNLDRSRRARLKNMKKVCGNICKGIKVEPINWGGHKAFCLAPALPDSSRVIVYLHGGAYIGSTVEIYNGFVSRFARELNLRCFNLEYPLAPEFPYPHALNTLIDFYKQMLNRGYKPSEIIFAGDSAGAGLCLSAALKIRETGLSFPGAFILFSPWVDLTNSGESILTNKNTDYMITKQLLESASQLYCGDLDPLNPYISPVFANFKDFPPVYLLASAEELLLSDCERLHDALERDNVDVSFFVWEGTQHAFVVAMRLFPESIIVIEDIKKFISGIACKEEDSRQH